MMELVILGLFVIGYVFIALEHKFEINKTAVALLTGVVCWMAWAFFQSDHHLVMSKLLEHVGDFSGLLFFLMGAMVIVELIDAHQGFEVITDKINTRNKRKLLIIISILTFFVSSVFDNLTTTIIFIALIRKIVPEQKERLLFASLIVIAANAGGAWTPIGDVTTTMLWMGNQITTGNIMKMLFFPSIVSILVPLAIVCFQVKGNVEGNAAAAISGDKKVSQKEKVLIFSLGIGAILFVPVFKTITHLPPFMGMLLGLAVMWIVTGFIHKDKEAEKQHRLSIIGAMQRMDLASVLFFLGILLAIAALESSQILASIASYLDTHVGDTNIIAVIIGLLSAIVDNVPIVAASMGMYPLETFPTDHSFWELLAFCAGTGGSILIIGSAAGVAAMGLEKIDFFWYLKKISWLAAIGYFAGIGTYLLQQMIF